MDNKQFIINKVEQLKALANNQEDPVFIVTARMVSSKGKTFTVELKSLYFSDDNKPMKKETRLMILNYLEKFVKDEKAAL